MRRLVSDLVDACSVINSVPGGFNPEQFGLHGLGLVSVVCNGKLIHAVVGDTNDSQIGEMRHSERARLTSHGSVALAKACFGDGVNAAYASPQRVLCTLACRGRTDQPDVAYTGRSAVAKSLAPSSLNALGHKLLSSAFK